MEKLRNMGKVDIVSYLTSREKPVDDQACLRAAMKAEASAGAAAAVAGIASTSNKRKQPPVAMSFGLPMSTRPGSAALRAFSAAGASGEPVLLQLQQSFGMSTTRVPRPQGPGFPRSGDALQLWDAMAKMRAAKAKADEHAAKAAKLSEELRLVKSWNIQYQNELATERAQYTELMGYYHAAIGEVAQLKAAITQLKAEHAATITQLKAEHAAENAQLKKELLAENDQLREEFMAEVIQLRNEAYGGGRDRDNELLHDYNDMGCSPLATAEDH